MFPLKTFNQVFLKEFLLIFTSSITVLMLQWAVYSMFNEIDSFDRTLRSELEEFEIYFNLSSKFLIKALPQVHRRTVGKRYASPYGTLRNTYLQSGSMPDCPLGVPGWPGNPGFDGIPGPDGPPGLDGIPGFSSHDRYGVPHLSCTMCPAGPPGRPGDPGSEGPRGPPGSIGPSATSSYGYSVPGPRGPTGDSGRHGREGEQGRSGSPGAPGIRSLRGSPGRRGSSGPQGPPGRAGESKPRAERGVPGPRGIPGMEGRKGKDGVYGRNGKAGLRGHNGKDGLYCPCPSRATKESYYTVLPNSVPWEDPANALVERLARRSNRFPRPPIFPMIPIEGDVRIPLSNTAVEDISKEQTDTPPTPDPQSRLKWADVMAKRKRRWQQRAGSSPTQPEERKDQDENVKFPATIVELTSQEKQLQRSNSVVLNEMDPAKIVRLQLESLEGSLSFTEDSVKSPAC